VHQQYCCVGVTLFVNLQGCGRPQEADGQKVDTHVFFVVWSITRKMLNRADGVS